MPAHVKTANASQQNQKHDQKTQKQRFANGHEIREALKTQNQELLLQNLTTLRNQISLRATEDVLAPNDERLLLAQNWLEQGENGKEIFELWDASGPKQSSLISLLLSILSTLLDLLSHHYPFQTTGHSILKTLLSPQYVRRLNAYIGGSQNELILLTLKLYNSMSNFAGGREKKLVLESFAWEMKSLPKLMSMRRKTKPGETTDSLQRPDIRTLYILFLLSFLAPTTVAAIKTTFLEQHRDQFLLIFKGLNQDSYSVIRKITEVCWTGIWGDAKIKRTLKISLFNESTLGHIHKLYERSNPEQDNPEYIAADLIHHFLLAICTRPGVGICFKDHGWYPRDTESDAPAAAAVDIDFPDKQRGGSAGKIYNKILSNFVKTLKVNEDARQQELALRILASCPELVAGYWPTASLALEPRLSSKWITNVAYFGTVVSLPIPTSCFLLERTKNSEASMCKPTPPPLNAILSSFLPSSTPTKLNFTKGLQSASGLVQHCSAIALAKCLSKYESVIQTFKDVEAKLEEVEGEGQWSKRRKEVEREARRRVPEFQVIVSFSQSKFGLEATTNPTPAGDGTTVQREPNEVKAAMLSEVAHRLLWMYHRCLPGLVAEARFDVGKLLVQCGFTETAMNDQRDDGDGEEDEEEEEESEGGEEGVAMEGVEGTDAAVTERTGEDDDSNEAEEEAQEPDLDKPEQLSLLKGLHVLRLLKESEQFVWSAKSGASGETYFATLLKAYALSRSQSSTRVALAELLQHVLSQSILFQEDSSEAALWLLCLPTYRRRPGISAPDDAPLEDEIDAVVAFLDDCVQRCLKTPYKYIEELYAVAPSPSSPDGEDVTMGERSAAMKHDVYPSPLLMTVLEQLSIKVQKKLLSPSAVLALATFTRKLGFRLFQKLEDKQFLVGVCQRVEVMLKEENLFSEFSVMTAAIRRECRLLKALTTSEVVVGVSAPATSQDLHEFLDILEDMPIPVTPSGRENTAVELIDWVRLVGEELGSEEVKAVWDCLMKLDPSKLNDLVYALDPTFDILWPAINHEELREHIEFDLLFVHCCHSRFFEQEEARPFAKSTFVNDKDFGQMKRLVTMISHYVPRPSTSQQPALVAELMHLLAQIFKSAKRVPQETSNLKELLFTHLHSIKEYLVWHQSNQEVVEGIQDLVHSSVDPSNAADQSLVSSVTAHWLHLVQSQVLSAPSQFATALLWLEYLPASALLGLLDTFIPVQEKDKLSALQIILQVLNKSPWNSDVDAGIQQRLSLLVPLQGIIHDADDLDELIARGVTSSLPPYLDGAPFRRNTFDESSFVEVLRNARSRWLNRLGQLSAENPAVSFLKQDTWSKSTVAIIKGLIYRRSLPEGAFVDWLGTAYQSTAVDAFIPVLRAVADISEWSSSGDPAVWEKQFDYALNAALNTKLPTDVRLSAAECLGPILQRISPTSSELVSASTKRLNEVQPKDFGVVVTTIGMQLRSLREVDTQSLMSALVNAGVKWAIRASDQTSSDEDGCVMGKLASLVSGTKGIQTSLVETYLTVVIQERLSSESNLALAKALLSSTHLKPVVVNRHLQSIIQHPDFFKICSVNSPEKHLPRHGVIALLHALFCLHPTNTCQPSHVEPLVKVYQGKLSTVDVQILSIFRLFEEERKTSISSLIGRWSPSKSTESATSLEAIQGLDPALVLRTTLNFPDWRKLDQVATSASTTHEEQLYDPVFLVLLFAQILAEHPPNSALGWVEMFRSNVVGLVIRMLSARDVGLRELALTQLAALWHHLESADLHEKPHVIHVLSLLRDAIPRPQAEEPPVRLPTYSTLLLAHALRGIFYPSNFIYPITARFLLQRPEIDTGDVPLLFSMLYSSSDDWKKERGWILRFLADGMVGSDDWRVLKRRHTWDLLASMYQASPDDRQLRAGIFEVLASLTCHPQATMSLVLRSSLLPWIESQLLAERVSDGVECVKILENIMTIADTDRIESATSGEWRATISRCLLKLLDIPDALPFVVSAILRLSLLPGSSSSSPVSEALLPKAVECLERYEANVKIPSAAIQVHPIRKTQSPPYKAHEIHQLFTEGNNPLALWGYLVEALWRSSMSHGSKTGAWDRLTTRLLLWRALVGSDGSEVGEWARLQVVHSISSN